MTTLEILKKAKALELSSAPLTTEQKNTAIMLCADALCENATEILAANAKDVENARGKISEVMIDRLRLDETRIAAMADGMRAVAQLPDPVGRVLEDIKRADGLDIKNIGAYGRGGYNLREPPECHLRRGGALLQIGKHLCFTQRQGGLRQRPRNSYGA